MLVESIKVIETSPCLADEEKFKALTVASASLSELLPYLNRELEDAYYRPQGNTLTFKKGIVGFTLIDNQINITKFLNNTELHELLDWVKDFINDVHQRKGTIEPNYEEKTVMPVLDIFKLLPKTNCKKCGEPTCMAFAAKLNKIEGKVDECPTLNEDAYQESKRILSEAF